MLPVNNDLMEFSRNDDRDFFLKCLDMKLRKPRNEVHSRGAYESH